MINIKGDLAVGIQTLIFQCWFPSSFTSWHIRNAQTARPKLMTPDMQNKHVRS